MFNKKWRKALQPKNVVLATVLAVAGVSAVAQNLPDLGLTSGDPWNAELYYENHTALRDKAGLSKFRNTLQSEMSKNLNDGWRFRGILRGTYDGVYDLNKSEYGKNAGGSVTMNNTLGPSGALGVVLPASVAYGGAFLAADNSPQAGTAGAQATAGLGAAFGAPANAAGVYAYRNEGLQIVGSGWNTANTTAGAISLATPVRPCNYDSRGCMDFGGYGNKTQAQLAAPEFNSRLDFIREAYVTNTFKADGGDVFLKLGKQQVVWGRTDLFRVLDVINPVDYSRNNIYDELQDIRIPMWIAQAEYRMGASENMQDRNLSVVWNFDQFRPNNLGQGGTPNSILDAGNLFRGLRNCWVNGCTVGAFGADNPLGGAAFNFGPGQLGIRNVDLPNWSLANTQLGIKFEGVTKEGLSFSLNGLTYRSQLPSLRGGIPVFDPFLTNTMSATNGAYVPAFDMVYPRVNLVGGSMDFQVESLGAAMRLEGAYTRGEEFANTLNSSMYSKNPVWRSVIGFDRPTFVPFISTERTVLFSGQLFYQHIFNHQQEQRPWGMAGMPDWKDNAIATLLMKAFLMNDRLSPEIIFARDFRAQANVIAPAVEWLYTDNLKLKFGANVKFGHEQNQWKWSHAAAADAYHNTGPTDTPYATLYDTGLGGMEPLGRFRAGPIGTAFGQNEIYATLRYKF
ncbi:DUF1302 domain-containing protein [Polynucleobacter sp. MWH-Spelu-300-X4]|uniref:DUF1302 family protein n=1 Tax=Polynucleobacter sp. MWH-Spelu-300-X4 TaxID=2689109 RepID=UPI001BFEA454|nr:DUF1302 family protein [Polynucleobacter sp. MWH-Spelu-300-X4]QWD79930.1 DUF1302 domain-containing protein [Polynucleobacter sp. MWH-Spelu-300-X4]